MHLTNKTNTIFTIIFLIGLFVGLALFTFTVFSAFVKPFFLTKPKEVSTISLDTLLDEAAEYISKRGGLTVATPSATLTNEAVEVTAEVINASGVPNAARSVADGLTQLGITVSRIGNSTEPAEGNVLALKDKALVFRDRIVEKVSTNSAEVRIEKLEETYPFDIRIVIGK